MNKMEELSEAQIKAKQRRERILNNSKNRMDLVNGITENKIEPTEIKTAWEEKWQENIKKTIDPTVVKELPKEVIQGLKIAEEKFSEAPRAQTTTNIEAPIVVKKKDLSSYFEFLHSMLIVIIAIYSTLNMEISASQEREIPVLFLPILSIPLHMIAARLLLFVSFKVLFGDTFQLTSSITLFGMAGFLPPPFKLLLNVFSQLILVVEDSLLFVFVMILVNMLSASTIV